MIIAQITDLHVVARYHLCYGEIPTNAQTAEAGAHINRLVAQPDAVIASGDAKQRRGTRIGEIGCISICAIRLSSIRALLENGRDSRAEDRMDAKQIIAA